MPMSDQTPAERVAHRLEGYRELLVKKPDCWPGDQYGKGGGAEYIADLSALLAQREALLEALTPFAEASRLLSTGVSLSIAEDDGTVIVDDEDFDHAAIVFATSDDLAPKPPL